MPLSVFIRVPLWLMGKAGIMFFSRRRKAQRCFRVRLTLEPLEERTLLQGIPLLVTTNADHGPGSLRDAITTANTLPGPTRIDFAIGTGPQTIAILSPLPLVNAPVVIDGTSQPGYSGTPVITLTQSSMATGVTDGLNLYASGSTVEELLVTGFVNGDGIAVTGNNETVGGTAPGAGNVITGNQSGIVVGGLNNVIAGNIVSGNLRDGVDVSGSGASVIGNRIGTNAGGDQAMPNGGNGVSVIGTHNTIGGTTPAARNVISGNRANGINVSTFLMSDNIIEGNYIGTNAAGSAALPNALVGVTDSARPLPPGSLIVQGPSDTTIGGTAAGAGNLISGNGVYGIMLAGTSGAMVQNNKVGTDAVGTVAVPNAYDGIYVIGSDTNTISGNLVSGNGRFGVFLLGQPTTNGMIETNSVNNVVQNNIIGLGQGAARLGNADDGVALFSGAANNTIGGNAPGAGNLISGNGRLGVYLNGSETTGNLIQGNRIGTSADGTTAEGNALDGIAVMDGATLNVIGGTVAGAGNVISGNGRDGIFMDGAGPTNAVEGNLIGTNAAGNLALGNHANGIALAFTPNTFIGGTTAGAGNVISGNLGDGVVLAGGGTTGNVVQDNFIGTDKAGSAALGNSLNGVDIGGGAAGNVIGGTASGAANTIAFNGRTGVVIGTSPSDTGTTGDSVLGNSIYTNSVLGIDLGNNGPTANTPGGPHSGPNHFQNFPVIQSVTASGSGTVIAVALNSTPFHGFRIEVFADTDGQGRTFLGAGSLATDGNGNGNGSTTITVATAFSSLVGQRITATATDTSTGDTSEFSFPAFVVASG